MSNDRIWNQRIRLSDSLLLEVVDWWCRNDREFPVDSTVASLLFIFSPRCSPFSIPEQGLRERLFGMVGSPVDECALTWPKRGKQQQGEFVSSITAVLRDAVDKWDEGLLTELPVDLVNQWIVNEIIDHKYVTFHHHQTTLRDSGGFHGHY